MARLQDELQDGGDWAGETIKAVRKLKEIVASDDKDPGHDLDRRESYFGAVPPQVVENLLWLPNTETGALTL